MAMGVGSVQGLTDNHVIKILKLGKVLVTGTDLEYLLAKRMLKKGFSISIEPYICYCNIYRWDRAGLTP